MRYVSLLFHSLLHHTKKVWKHGSHTLTQSIRWLFFTFWPLLFVACNFHLCDIQTAAVPGCVVQSFVVADAIFHRLLLLDVECALHVGPFIGVVVAIELHLFVS